MAIKQNQQVAYFCMEFALTDDFHIYSGGLGVLAGDYLLECDAQNCSTIGIGLFYSSFYTQTLSADGKVTDELHPLSAQELGLERVLNSDNSPLTLQLPLKDRTLHIQAWVKTLKHVKLYLLDTNIDNNDQDFRFITDQLYQGDRNHRILQEFVLGIGGLRLLYELGTIPDMIHMNEGHAAFCSIEDAVQTRKKKNCSFIDAIDETKKKRVFSNHTLIPAGNDIFSSQLVFEALGSYAKTNDIELQHILELGNDSHDDTFSMTTFSFNTTCKTNAVSVFHAQKALDQWPNHPMIPITNGIYLPRWYARENNDAWPLEQSTPTEPIHFWHTHQEAKDRLIQFLHARTGVMFSSEAIIITWARRFVDYKRPEALFWKLDWLQSLLDSSPVPTHFIFSGKGHPNDLYARQMVERVVRITKRPEFSQHIHYIPNYNLEVAEYLVQGSDVWLNTPTEGFEACGTSGMKAALNGVLQCSTNDGWVREVSWDNIGWILDDKHISESLYTTIGNQIIPLFSERDSRGVPTKWVERMINTAQIIRTQYSSQRMLNEYYAKLYE